MNIRSFLLTTTSLAVSRVMFSIHSLAASIGSDSAWLLNNVELSRAGWKQGAREGELVIERDTVEDDYVVPSDLENGDRASLASKGSLYTVTMTRAWTLDGLKW